MKGKKIKVLSGDRYGRLTIINEVEKRHNARYFECKCDCGKVKIILFTSLTSDRVKSCGCLRDEHVRESVTKHNLCNSRIYSIWKSMKRRCLNSKDTNYKHYGGRGITIIHEWLNFETFHAWAISNGYKDNLSIDRYPDMNGNYEPVNCRWSTQKEQMRNTRRNNLIEFKGEIKCHTEWALCLGITPSALQYRLKKWPIEKVIIGSIRDRQHI